MAQSPSLNTKNKPSWAVRTLNALTLKFLRIEPQVYAQEQGITFGRFGIAKGVGGQFRDIGGNLFAIECRGWPGRQAQR